MITCYDLIAAFYVQTHTHAGMCAVYFNLSNLIDGISEQFQLNVPLQMHFE